MDLSERLYTVEEVAEILRVSRNMVYRLIRERQLAMFRINDTGNWRISSARLNEFIKAQTTPWPNGNGDPKKR